MGKVRARVEQELTLHVRQLAWLNATPKPPDGSKRAKSDVELISRFERLKRQKITPELPPVMLPHVISRLVEIGLTGSTGMGAVPLAWLEIVAWQQATGVVLTPWEARTIRALSTAYLAELRSAEQETCPPPWRAAVTAHERTVERDELLALLRG